MGKVPQVPLKRFREGLVEFGHRECFSERALANSHHRPRTALNPRTLQQLDSTSNCLSLLLTFAHSLPSCRTPFRTYLLRK